MTAASSRAATPTRPHGRLHETIERQARQIDLLKRRLADLGRERAALRAWPLGELRPDGYQPVSATPSTHLPAAVSWWPTEPLLTAPLEPKPGHLCATLGYAGLPVVAVSVCGLPRQGMARIAAEVADKQARERSFLPLFLADSAADLDLFREQGHSVELLPSETALQLCRGTREPEAHLRRRLERINAQWGIARLADLGSRPLAHLFPRPASAEGASIARLVFWKDYRRYNPYQYLLYASLPGVAAEPGDIEAAHAAARARREGSPPVVFHLNWEEAVYGAADTASAAREQVTAFLARLDGYLADGGRLLWTIHNSEPHENRFPRAHDRLARALARRAHLVHVHSHAMATLVRQRYGAHPDRLLLAPHGDYRGVLEPFEDRRTARRELGVPAARTCFGLVGTIRPYKGADDLLAAFGRLERGRAALVLAGRQEPALALDALPTAVRSELICRDAFIPDAELPRIVAACDLLVLPYRRIATSGSIMLAFSLATPVVAPDLPTVREVVRHGDSGLLYPPEDPDGLVAALRLAMALPPATLGAMRAAARATAVRLGWDWIGRRIAARLRMLLPPPD